MMKYSERDTHNYNCDFWPPVDINKCNRQMPAHAHAICCRYLSEDTMKRPADRNDSKHRVNPSMNFIRDIIMKYGTTSKIGYLFVNIGRKRKKKRSITCFHN